jgi:hypothetical protein
MSARLTIVAPAWHAEAATMLQQNFAKVHASFCDATKRAVWLGLFLGYIKERGRADKSIPHGRFGTWMEANVSEVSWNLANRYMAIGRGVAEKGKFQIVHFAQFAQSGNLPDPVLALIEGKTQQQLFLEFKQVEQGPDGEFHVKHGRLKGQGGRKPTIIGEDAKVDTDFYKELINDLLQVSDPNDKSLFEQSPNMRARLREAAEGVAIRCRK